MMCSVSPRKTNAPTCGLNFGSGFLARSLYCVGAAAMGSMAIWWGLLGLPARGQVAEQLSPPPPPSSEFGIEPDDANILQPRAARNANILKPGDELQLTVLGFPELSGSQTILADGSIQLPLVGSVFVEGLTPEQTVDALTEGLTPYVRRPQVSLTLLHVRPPQISVTGEVRRPGAHLLVPPDDIDDDLEIAGEEFQTLTYALVTAGGVTPDADLRNIVIRRRLSPTTDPAAGDRDNPTEIRVDLWSLVRDGDLSSDIRVYHSDEIIVPAAQLARTEREKLLGSTLAPVSIAVQVAGEVREPGQLQIAADADVNTAVIAAGGFTEDAREDRIALFRMSPEGRLERQVYAFGEASTPLLDGDVIVVDVKKRRGVRNAFGFAATLLSPFTSLFFLLD